MLSGGVKAVSRRERSREALVAKLLPAVEALLAEGATYTDLSVEEIIERAGAPRSTFYYHFRDKGELLIAVSADAIAEIVEISKSLYRDGLQRSPAVFTAAVRNTAATWLSHMPLMNALAELAAYNPAVNEQFLIAWQSAEFYLADHIRTGQAAGLVRSDLHPEHVAAWLTWMAERGLGLHVWSAPPAQVDAALEALATIVWHTLYADRHAPEERSDEDR